MQFHTSCSQPLDPGDQFGAFELQGFVAEFGRKAVIAEDDKVIVPVALPLTGCYAGSGPAPGRSYGDLAVVALLAGWLTLSTARRRAGKVESK